MRAIRSLWMTRLTNDIKNDKGLYMKTTLRELTVYVAFLVVVCILSFGMTSTTMYYYTKVMQELFVDAQFSDTKNTFQGQTTMEDFWRFALKDPLLNGLYWEKWYNDRPVEQNGFIFYGNRVLGVPRLRQLRVRDNSCKVHDLFKKKMQHCYDHFHESIEERSCIASETLQNETTVCDGDIKNQIGNRNIWAANKTANSSVEDLGIGYPKASAWVYETEKDLDGSNHYGEVSSYHGGGYVQELAAVKEKSENILKYLMKTRWLDRSTRAVFIDFTVYNANINLFCVVRLLFEYPATGGVVPSWSFRTVKLLRYVTTSDFAIFACEVVFVLFIIYYIIEKLLEIEKHRLSYFKSFWNLMDLLVIMISIICIAFNAYRQMKVSSMMAGLLAHPNNFADFEFLSYWQIQFNSAIGVAVFISWIKIFKYISFNKTMTQMSGTLSRCAKDLASFGTMFSIIFFAFAQLGYLLFGSDLAEFSTMWNTLSTLFRIILGDFDFLALERAHRFLGPVYFVFYVFFVFFVLFNMFLAIINDSYSEVKSDLWRQENEFELIDYLMQTACDLLVKMNLMEEKQEAITEYVVLDEWQSTLIQRGFKECEIAAVFAKYDFDGDHALSVQDREHLCNDLEDQKRMIDLECSAMRHKQAVSDEMTDPTEDEDTRIMTNVNQGKTMKRENDEGERKWESGFKRPDLGGQIRDAHVRWLKRRVDRLERTIVGLVSKIDAVLMKASLVDGLRGRIIRDHENKERNKRRGEQLTREEFS